MSTLLLEDVKTFLNITGTTTNAEVQAMIDAAEAAVAKRVGPLASTSTTSRVYTNGAGPLMLPVLPVISLTSVTPVGGTALSLTDVYLDTDAGLVTDSNGFPLLAGWYTVVYAAGRASLPADVSLAVKELVRHLWTSQRGSGGSRPGPMSPEMLSNTLPGAAYALPIRVEQLLAPYMQFGFA